ncbi:YchF family ATPase [Patescibacteria group bacterium]|nr:YchF family ATPase [Patescibacteria group bacterium]MCL5114564.1 YchF family ATPase [Patescibacteria group bacterium]
MKLEIGIVGLPNVGKSTLFKIITSQEVHIANYPFATIDPNVGVVPVPDERVDKLADMSKSKKRVPAVVEFYDIAGLVRGAYKGEGLGNQFLSHIRNVQVIVHIVRCFENNDIVHVEGNVNPIRDIDTIESELIFKDLDTIEKRLGKLEADARSGDKQAKIDLEILKKAKEILGKGELLTTIADEKIVKELQLLTSKQQIFLLNGKAEDVREDVKEKIRGMRFEFLIADLSDEESLPNLVKAAYFTLSLISFFTTGEDETRAWTIERGMKAPQAAGVIHTDFENKFIRAEVVNWEKLLQAGGWSQAKQKGWLRLEGKDYVVEDGDVMVIRHG